GGILDIPRTFPRMFLRESATQVVHVGRMLLRAAWPSEHWPKTLLNAGHELPRPCHKAKAGDRHELPAPRCVCPVAQVSLPTNRDGTGGTRRPQPGIHFIEDALTAWRRKGRDQSLSEPAVIEAGRQGTLAVRLPVRIITVVDEDKIEV